MVEKYTLIKPVTFEGVEVTEIDYDLDELTGTDIIRVAKATPNSENAVIPYTMPEFQAGILAAAAKKPIELIVTLKGVDFLELTSRVLCFFTGQG